MNKLILLLSLFSIGSIGCGDDDASTTECGSGTTLVDGECVADVVCGAGTTAMDGMCIPDDDPNPPAVFTQIEHLARPGINEALLLTDGFLAGYNATAPSFTGVPADVLNQVVGEAKTVLKALYLGSCLVSGALGLTPDAAGNALKPGLIPCDDVGGNVFANGNVGTGTTLSTTSAAAAQTYADRMFAQFVPDVMRIDTATTSSYLNAGGTALGSVCGDPTASSQLLCGGRLVDDDVIDVTFNYLIGGLAGTPGPQDSNGPGDTTLVVADQVRALTSDGVAFDTGAAAGAGNNKLGLTNGVAGNTQQDHPATTNEFPYSAAPF